MSKNQNGIFSCPPMSHLDTVNFLIRIFSAHKYIR